LNAKESEISDDERKGSSKKCSSSFKVFARKIRSVNDALNKSNKEDNLHDNKESKDKSQANEQ